MSNRTRVVIIGNMHPAGPDLLQADPGLEVQHHPDARAADVPALMTGAEALLIRALPVTAEALDGAPELRVVSRHGVGFDNVDVAALEARGIPLVVVGEANSVSVAEHVFALLLDIARRVPWYDSQVRAGQFLAARYSMSTMDLAGKTLLIIGLGRIGRRVARRAEAFEMRVLAHDPYLAASDFAERQAQRVDDLDTALAEADVVTLHCPLNDETRNLFDAARLSRMRRGAVLINCARGGLVDEAALAAALTAGHLRGAGVDAYSSEPPPPGHPLFAVDSAVLSAHSAASTLDCTERMSLTAARNLLDALNERLDPALVVNPSVLRGP